jgi:hypothetical protein
VRDNTPPGLLLLGIVLLIVVIAIVIWQLQHPDIHHH